MKSAIFTELIRAMDIADADVHDNVWKQLALLQSYVSCVSLMLLKDSVTPMEPLIKAKVESEKKLSDQTNVVLRNIKDMPDRSITIALNRDKNKPDTLNTFFLAVKN